MFSTQSILLFSALFASAIMSATAISCYQCNSEDHPECDTLDVRRPDLIAQFFQRCDGDYDGAIPFCRKIDLTVKEGDLQRTIRSCGWVKTNERVSCYKADNDDHLETVCQCFEDGCNGAAAATTSLAAAGAAAFALVASAALLQR